MSTPSADRGDFGGELRSLRQASRHSLLDTATQAGVSPNTWQQFERSEFGPASTSEWRDATARQRAAWLRTAIRVLRYRDAVLAKNPDNETTFASIETRLKIFNIHRLNEDELSQVERLLSEPREQNSLAPLDSAWAALKRGQLIVGMSAWRPFGMKAGIERIQLNNAQKNDIRDAETYSLLRSILGFVQSDTNEKFLIGQPIENLAESMEDLANNTRKKGSPNLLFGIYDTPGRRLAGLRFVNLPGLAFGLGILRDHDTTNFEPLKFLDNLMGASSASEMHVVVIKADIGYDFVCGQCQKSPTSDVSVFRLTQGISKIAAEIADIKRREAKNVRPRPVYFIGDVMLCDSLRHELTKIGTKSTISVLQSDEYPFPSYNAGFVLRDDDPLVPLLEECLYGSFFDGFAFVLAFEYAKLLGKSMYLESSVRHIRLRQLEALSDRQKLLFTKAVKFALKGTAVGLNQEEIESQINEVWVTKERSSQ